MHDIALTPAARASLETMHRRIVRLGLLDDRPERVGWISSDGTATTGTVLTAEEELRGGPLRYRTRSAMGAAALPEGYYSVRITHEGLRIQQWDAEDHLRRVLRIARRAGRGRYGIGFVPAVEGEAAQPLGGDFREMPVEAIVHLRRLRALAADPPRVFVVEVRTLRARLVADKPIRTLPLSVDPGLDAIYQQEFTGVDAVRRDRALGRTSSGLRPLGTARFDERWPHLARNTWPAGPESWRLLGAPDGTTVIMSEGLADPVPDDGLRVERPGQHREGRACAIAERRRAAQDGLLASGADRLDGGDEIIGVGQGTGIQPVPGGVLAAARGRHVHSLAARVSTMG